MPQIDQIAFLEDRNASLQKHIFYVYSKNSGAYLGATVRKIKASTGVKSALLSNGVSDQDLPRSINYGGLLSLTSERRYVVFDLSGEPQNEKIDQDVEKTLAVIGKTEESDAGLILIIPSKAWDASSGPIWYSKAWPSWQLAASKATVILEPMISIDTTAAIVRRITALTNVFDFSHLANQNAFIEYFTGFVKQKSPNLLQLVHRVEYALLVAVDRESGAFDRKVLAQQEREAARFKSIGANLRLFLKNPNNNSLRTLILALDERVNRRELKPRFVMQQLFESTQAHIISSAFDDHVVYWAWLLLSKERLLIVSKVPVVTCDALLRRYIAFLKKGAERNYALSLNAAIEPLRSSDTTDRDDIDSLDEARIELASALLQWAQQRVEVSLPHWGTRLRDALLSQ